MNHKDAENALYWLLALFTVRNREGWEEGPTEEEIRERVLDFLSNAGLDPYAHEAAVRWFRERVKQRGHTFDFSLDMGGGEDVAAQGNKLKEKNDA